jgi:hypothetical protein
MEYREGVRPPGPVSFPKIPSRVWDPHVRRKSQEQRAGVIDRLLNETNKQGEKTEVEGTPVKEVAPAK